MRDYHHGGCEWGPSTACGSRRRSPSGALPSLGAAGVTCDVCHNEAGPDLNRSFQMDGFANMSLLLNPSELKVGPFPFPVAVKDNFHVASNDSNKIAFLRAGAFCNTCHDVRVPNRELYGRRAQYEPRRAERELLPAGKFEHGVADWSL